MPSVTFTPSGRTIEVEAGVTLADAFRKAGLRLSLPCGGKGLCGKCRVQVLEGDVPVDHRHRASIPDDALAAGWRAACVARVTGDLVVAEPGNADADAVILTDFSARGPRGGSGWWERAVTMTPPSPSDQTDDHARFLQSVGTPTPTISLPLLSRLPGILRDAAWRCTAVGWGDRVLAVSGQDEGMRKLGLAVDLGTTTIAGVLCDLDTRAVLAVAASANPQAVHGDDVISRIEYASRGRTELRELQAQAVGAIARLADETCTQAGITGSPLFVTVAGNTVMTHLLAGVPPATLASSPFVPVFRDALSLCAAEIGWPGEAPPWLYTLPNVSAYIGGDITAGLLAHDVHRQPGVTLFLDVGTNGEIVLAVDGVLYACSAAAGPAFEGARIAQGMRAVAGAVSRVEVTRNGALDIGVIQSPTPAVGICGTGLLDAAAALRRAGVMNASGQLVGSAEARAQGAAAGVASLLHDSEAGPAIWLERPSGRGGAGVALTQQDIREFQLAKGAIAAGVSVLLGEAGLAPGDVDQVLLAGGFGNYLNPASAVAVGLLPPGIAVDRVRSIGNASLAGARLCLLSEDERAEATSLAGRIRYIELSGRDDFQTAFAENMLFP